MKSSQKKILHDIADSHGISKTQAKEIWKLYTNKVANTISKEDKKEKGKFVNDNFKVVHISNFGKFIPNQKKINFANMCIDKKREKDGK